MFYDVFSDMCFKKGVSRHKAATDIGLSGSLVTKWKKTGATPSGATMAKIASYFGVSVDSLLGLAPETQDEPKKSEESEEPKNTNVSAVDEAIKAALWHDDTDLTKEDIDELWEDIRAYKDFRTDQRRKQKKE